MDFVTRLLENASLVRMDGKEITVVKSVKTAHMVKIVRGTVVKTVLMCVTGNMGRAAFVQLDGKDKIALRDVDLANGVEIAPEHVVNAQKDPVTR